MEPGERARKWGGVDQVLLVHVTCSTHILVTTLLHLTPSLYHISYLGAIIRVPDPAYPCLDCGTICPSLDCGTICPTSLASC